MGSGLNTLKKGKIINDKIIRTKVIVGMISLLADKLRISPVIFIIKSYLLNLPFIPVFYFIILTYFKLS